VSGRLHTRKRVFDTHRKGGSGGDDDDDKDDDVDDYDFLMMIVT
jgi:hypothetical protein